MQPLRPPASADGAFVRVRTLGFAVEYAGIRVREGTTASETVNLVASKLRLDAAERRSRQLVAVYPVRRRPAPGRRRQRPRIRDTDILAIF